MLKRFEIALDQSCHEVDLNTFMKMTDKKSYGTVSNLSKAEVYALGEAAKGYVFNYSVVADGERYANVGSDAKALSCYGHNSDTQSIDYIGTRESLVLIQT